MSHFILVASSMYSLEGKLIPAIEVAKNRVAENYWPLYRSTSHRKSFKAGDEALIYLSGEHKNSQSFYCRVSIESVDDDLNTVPKYEEKLIAKNPYSLLKLSNSIVFPNLLPIKPMLKDLELIKDEAQWGKYLQGGAKFLSHDDFHRISVAADR